MTLKNWLKAKILGKERFLRSIGLNFGSNCRFADSIDFGSEPYLITIGNDFYSSDNIVFATHDGSVHVIRNVFPEFERADKILPINIGDNVFIGHSTIILPGTKIHSNIIIGANSVVSGELKDPGVYAGSPAKFICTLDSYVARNNNFFHMTKGLSPRSKKEYYERLFQ